MSFGPMNAPVQPAPAVAPPAVPLLDEGWKKFVASLDDSINNIIHSFGEKLDNMTSAIREVGKGSVLKLAENRLSPGQQITPDLSPPSTPATPSQGTSPQHERSNVPERVQELARTATSTGSLQVAMQAEHVPDGTMVCPACTPGMGYGMGQGRGGMGIG